MNQTAVSGYTVLVMTAFGKYERAREEGKSLSFFRRDASVLPTIQTSTCNKTAGSEEGRSLFFTAGYPQQQVKFKLCTHKANSHMNVCVNS